MRLAVILWVLKLLILVKIATEEGESSSKVVISKTAEVIKKAKDKDKDIKITLNNNISLKRPVKVVPLPKFNSNLSKLKEYLNKV
jgi:uncharacterized membrane protein